MQFPAKKNAGCPKAPHDFPPRKDGILYPRRVDLALPSPSQSLADGRSRDYYVTTKISRLDRLPNFLSNGAPLAGFARRLRYKAIARAIIYICAQKLAVECRHLISSARSSKCCRLMVTNIGKDKPFPEYNCFFTMDLFRF